MVTLKRESQADHQENSFRFILKLFFFYNLPKLFTTRLPAIVYNYHAK